MFYCIHNEFTVLETVNDKDIVNELYSSVHIALRVALTATSCSVFLFPWVMWGQWLQEARVTDLDVFVYFLSICATTKVKLCS